MARTLFCRLGELFGAEDGVISVVKADEARLRAVLFANLEQRVIETLPFTGGGAPESPFTSLAGAPSVAEAAVARAYLLPTQHLRPDVADAMTFDRSMGIEPRAYNVNGLIRELAGYAPGSFAFSLWDNAVLIARDGGSWRISERHGEIDKARRFLDLLERRAPAAPSEDAPFEEPLFISIPIARELAERFCEREGDESCFWYHGFRPFLRLFNLVMAPGEQAELLETSLSRLAKSGTHGRVLISACADYGMLAQVLNAYGGVNAPCDVTIVDRCETPLRLCQWYADFVAKPIIVRKAYIESFTADAPFDVIFSHGFLTNFPPARWPAMVAKWRSLLRPGGAVVAVEKLRPHAAPGSLKRSSEHIRAFALRTADEARYWRDFLPLDAAWLNAEAERYAAEKRLNPVTSRGGFIGLFERAGFAAEDAGSVAIEGREYDLPPEQAGSADFIVCVATKL